MERRGEAVQQQRVRVGGKERTREEGRREEIYCHLFSGLRGPHPTSPVSPIVLHHNGGRLIILKTADYQSGRFQGPTSKQSQQYRTEREFLQQFGPLQIKKDPKPTQPAISFYTNPPNTLEMPLLQRACGYEWWWGAGGGFEQSGTHTRKVWLLLGKRSGAHVGDFFFFRLPSLQQ